MLIMCPLSGVSEEARYGWKNSDSFQWMTARTLLLWWVNINIKLPSSGGVERSTDRDQPVQQLNGKAAH